MYGFFPEDEEDFPRWKRVVLHVFVGLWACCLAAALFISFVYEDPRLEKLALFAYLGTAIFFACIPLWWFVSHMEIVRDEDGD